MEIIADRRALHQIPELEKDLPKTLAYLQKKLEGLGCRVFSPSQGSLCAWFDYGREGTVAFRADMDALPIWEVSNRDYASRHPGQMHACGHDGHMAILLELARRLSRRPELPKNVLLVFQPGEESPGGARDICLSGVFETYRVDAIFGLHIWPGLEAGKIFSRRREMMARASEVNVDVYGKSAHIAKASLGIDALIGAVEFYTKAMAMEAALPPEEYRLLKFGKFHSGTARNALSAHAHLEGSLRAFRDEIFEGLRQGLEEIGRDVEQQTGCTVKIAVADGYPAVWNPDELYDRVAAKTDFEDLPEPLMTAEDFSWYQRFIPGMFFFLGLGDVPALHTDHFDFDERLLLKGADFFMALAEADI